MPITVPFVPPYNPTPSKPGNDSGSFDPVTGVINDDLRDGYIKDIVTDPSTGEQTYVDHDSSLDDVLQDALNNQSSSALDIDSSSGANSSFLSLYKQSGDTAWLEKYLDNLVARENASSARQYETEMSNTAFTRMINDIKSAGYNPWLALQGSNGASTPASSASGMSSISMSSQRNQAAIQQNQATTELISRIISSVGVAAAVIISKIIFKM